jgi:hypothetical protein
MMIALLLGYTLLTMTVYLLILIDHLGAEMFYVVLLPIEAVVALNCYCTDFKDFAPVYCGMLWVLFP